MKEILDVLKKKHVGYLMLVKGIVGIPFGIFYAMFSMSVMDYFHLGPRWNGFILAYSGIVGMVS